MLHVHDPAMKYKQSRPNKGVEENGHSPKQIDVKHLAPILDAIPGGPYVTNASVVHEHGDLDHGEHI